jgi:hypothetical protein
MCGLLADRMPYGAFAVNQCLGEQSIVGPEMACTIACCAGGDYRHRLFVFRLRVGWR